MKPYLLALFLRVAIFSTPAMAQTHEGSAEVQVGELALQGAFIRATLPRAPVGGAYVTITNSGANDDRLVSATAPAGDNVAVRKMNHENGIVSMQTLPEGLPVPAREAISLVRGYSHMMINGLDVPLVKGQALDLTLTFEVAGDVTVRFDVLALNARNHPDTDNPGEHGD